MNGSGSRRLAMGILIGLFGIYLSRAAFVSVKEIIEVNDFEVFYNIGREAATHQPTIYEVVSPIKQRGPFLYPPSASILFVPLPWVSHDVAGVTFSIIKLGCLMLLLWGSLRFSGTPPRDWLGLLTAALVPAVLAHRAVDSDVGNGQINIVVAAAGVGGVWLMMLNRRWWWIGSLLLAWAIAVKLTPALLLAVPLLNRRWSAFITTTALTMALLIALPMAWFGAGSFADLMRQHRAITSRFTMDWPALERQVTINEMIQYTGVQMGWQTADRKDGEDLDRSPSITGKSGADLMDPAGRPVRSMIWFAAAVLVGLGYVAVRRTAFRGGAMDWTWDLAMLCALIVLLLPRVHKAHMVILIVPAGWIAARAFRWLESGWREERIRRWWMLSAIIVLPLLFLISENLRIPLPGVFEQPYRCLPFLALLLMILLVIHTDHTRSSRVR